MQDTRRRRSSESTKQGSKRLAETEAASRGLSGPLCICYGCYFVVFVRLITVGACVSLTLCLF